jgi:teichuronic acid biosynthesis glycosyltransferase TuaH
MYTPGFDVIMMALPRWDGLYSSTAYSLASAMSKHVRVFYIDNPFTLKDYITQYNSKQIVTRKKALLHGKNIFVRPEKDNQNLVVVTPRLTLPVNWLPSGIIYDSLARVNDAIVYDAIDATLQAYNSTRYVFINSFNPLFGRFFSNRFSPLLNIYHCVDDISKSLYISKHGTSLEITAVKNADFSIVTSRELQRLKSAQTSKPVYYLPNAANVELFQQAAFNELPAPSEISALPKERKVILYMGNICLYVAESHCSKFPRAYSAHGRTGE